MAYISNPFINSQTIQKEVINRSVSYTHLDVYKRQVSYLDHKKYHTYPIKLSSQNQPVHHPSFSVSINKINSLNEHQLDVNPVNDNKSPDLKDFVVRKKIILEGEVKDPATRKKVNEKYLTLYIAKTGSFQRITSNNGLIKSSIRDIKGNFSFQLLSCLLYTSRCV